MGSGFLKPWLDVTYGNYPDEVGVYQSMGEASCEIRGYGLGQPGSRTSIDNDGVYMTDIN